MSQPTKRKPLVIGGKKIAAGTTEDVRIRISETYLGDGISVYLRVIRARKPGPVVFVTAAIHGDELNGVGIIHELMFDDDLRLERGTLILVPVVNVFGFENNERYLPDRRDLNRCFPGAPGGSMAARLAHVIFEQVVRQSDYGIDLHTAAIQRTNYPNVRGDLKRREVRRLAEAFGCELILDGTGPVGSFRREACAAGCPTITVEAGEPWKIEPSVLRLGVIGVRNTLIELGLVSGERIPPPFQTRITKTSWVRAEVGGILRFHVVPGQIVRQGQPVASNYSILGRHNNHLVAPIDGIVLGMATHPAVKPGEPVCHIGRPSKKLSLIERALMLSAEIGTRDHVRTHLATSFNRVDPPPESVG